MGDKENSKNIEQGNSSVDKYELSKRVFGNLMEKIKIEIDVILAFGMKESEELGGDIHSVYRSGLLDAMGGAQKTVEYCFETMLQELTHKRDIDYLDIEYFLTETQEHLLKHGFDFDDYACHDEQGHKNNFEKYFQRPIIQTALDTYISSFNIKDKATQSLEEEKIGKQQLNNLRSRLKNVLHEPILEEFLVTLTDKGLIQLSDNLGNKFTKEIEQKILHVDNDDLVTQLGDMDDVEKTFEGRVTDEYYDFPDQRLEGIEEDEEDENLKSSFRIRKKENKMTGETKYYYTVKRKDKDSTDLHGYRDCWEEEYEILQTDYNTIQSMVTNLGLYKSREKTKYRTSYAHKKDKIKFDIDKYKGIPHVLEIEGESRKKIEKYKKKLGVDDVEKYPTSSKGSSWLHKKFKAFYKKFKPDGSIFVDEDSENKTEEKKGKKKNKKTKD